MPQQPSGPILVVDDDVDIREALRDTLEYAGYVVAEAGDGSAALTYLKENPLPPLVLLDWNMAPMNGPQFMEEFSKEPHFSGVPVVLLTADARVEDKVKTGDYKGYLKKPVNLDKLFDVIARFCRKNGKGA